MFKYFEPQKSEVLWISCPENGKYCSSLKPLKDNLQHMLFYFIFFVVVYRGRMILLPLTTFWVWKLKCSAQESEKWTKVFTGDAFGDGELDIVKTHFLLTTSLETYVKIKWKKYPMVQTVASNDITAWEGSACILGFRGFVCVQWEKVWKCCLSLNLFQILSVSSVAFVVSSDAKCFLLYDSF